MPQQEIVVIGGGIIGCSIALRLAKLGSSVTLLEKDRIGREASWAAAGMLGPHSEASGPDPFFDLCIRSRDLYAGFAAELREDSGVDAGYRNDGGFFVALEPHESLDAARWSGWQIDSGLELQQVSSSDLRSHEPEISDQIHSAISIPGDHQVDNRLLMTALEIAILRAGVKVVRHCEVASLELKNNRVSAVLSHDARFDCEAVVHAAGSLSSVLLKQIGLAIDVVPAHGQMLSVRGPHLNHVVHSNDCYLVPRADGRLLIGATVEYQGFRKTVTAGAIHSLLTSAMRLVPSIQNAQLVEWWSGLRPDTRDHQPLLGPAGPDGLFLATGHFRNGILLAPITAELISSAIMSGKPASDLGPFRADRFVVKRAGS